MDNLSKLGRRQLLVGGVAAAVMATSASAGQGSPPVSSGSTALKGVRWITLANGHRVWTQRVGSGPKKVLLLHGGPGFSHDYLECFRDYLPPAGYEIYFYDQLGCGRSDRPDDTSLWTVPRYLEEVEEVRTALGLDRFILYGHSWGGILGIEYALRHQDRLSAFVLSNMTASFADYGAYTVRLRAGLPADARAKLDVLEAAGKTTSPEFDAVLQKELYTRYICRLDPWPAPFVRSLESVNPVVYNQMQGPNEFAITGNLKTWDRWADLHRIRVPTLVMGARYDEMDPASIRREAQLIQGSRLFVSDRGSHLSMWDDQKAYFNALLDFLRTQDA